MSTYFAWDSVWRTDFITPVSSSYGNNREFGKNNSTTNRSCYFFRAFHTETDVSFAITDDNNSLETSTLTGTCLFLYGHNFQYFIFEIGQESIDYISFLNDQQSSRSINRIHETNFDG